MPEIQGLLGKNSGEKKTMVPAEFPRVSAESGSEQEAETGRLSLIYLLIMSVQEKQYIYCKCQYSPSKVLKWGDATISGGEENINICWEFSSALRSSSTRNKLQSRNLHIFLFPSVDARFHRRDRTCYQGVQQLQLSAVSFFSNGSLVSQWRKRQQQPGGVGQRWEQRQRTGRHRGSEASFTLQTLSI